MLELVTISNDIIANSHALEIQCDLLNDMPIRIQGARFGDRGNGTKRRDIATIISLLAQQC